MFKKIAQFVSRSIKPTAVVSAQATGPKMKSHEYDFYSKLLNNPTDAKTQALIDFTSSLKGLQLPSSEPSPKASVQKIISLPDQSTNVNALPVSKLEELARAHFTGVVSDNGETLVEKNFSKAITLWELASEKGSMESAYNLYSCYREGTGVPIDLRRARAGFLELAEKGYPFAHYSLALMLQQGVGGEPDDVEAFRHFQAAGRAGVTLALHNIGNCYAQGKGVKQSDYKALLFYEAAAEAGDPSAMFTVANWTYAGRQCPQDFKRAHEFQLRAADLGHPGATFNVGCNYMSGQGVQQDLLMAASFFERAADRGFAHAAINLGGMYRDGLGVQKDIIKARSIFARFQDSNDVCRESVVQLDEEMKSLESTKITSISTLSP